MKYVVSMSGGMDSTVLLAHLQAGGHHVRALTVDYGQRHRRELLAAERITDRYRVEWACVDLHNVLPLLAGSSQTSPDVPVPHGHYTEASMKQTVVPNRNMILLALAAAWGISVKADVVAYAAHAGDHAIYPDCRPQFLRPLAEALTHADWHPITLEAPFLALTKAEICWRGSKLGVPFDLTYSCYEGAAAHCGRCGTCVERREAFALAQVPDPTVYDSTDVAAR